jgi:hypothetical protein
MKVYANSRNKHCPSNPLKRLFRISDKTLVIIDDRIVAQLGITEETWVEQIITEEGITLKIRKFNEGEEQN